VITGGNPVGVERRLCAGSARFIRGAEISRPKRFGIVCWNKSETRRAIRSFACDAPQDQASRLGISRKGSVRTRSLVETCQNFLREWAERSGLAGLYVYESQMRAISERKIVRQKPVYGIAAGKKPLFSKQRQADLHR
jgi:hypothetical protein